MSARMGGSCVPRKNVVAPMSAPGDVRDSLHCGLASWPDREAQSPEQHADDRQAPRPPRTRAPQRGRDFSRNRLRYDGR
jgi:hypothetical protein